MGFDKRDSSLSIALHRGREGEQDAGDEAAPECAHEREEIEEALGVTEAIYDAATEGTALWDVALTSQAPVAAVSRT